MQFGKTIKIFLIDGDPNERLTCELSNWTGKAYKIPRIQIKKCVDRQDLNGTGVYLLFGKDEDENDLVYIGEAETILKRLNEHLKEKDFWKEVIVFVSKDDNLNKAHIKYLENGLYEIAKEVNRYKLENSNTPTRSSISESDRAEMEEFMGNIRLLVNTLGHKVFEEVRDEKIKQDLKDIFHIKAARGAAAMGIQSTEGFIVMKGSKFANPVVDSISPSLASHRERLINQGVLRSENGELVLLEDYIFSSPSTAAGIVMGRNANGLTAWCRRQVKMALSHFW
ncbi:GIY-YIG nuclease family protein [Priestia flexa]|uniref:GIY-YIG nuclease family protein n=1 Tax=Priestia flexa TaxID=86664 RepID=UPI001EF68901|nr:GIY-YIG nuclease family protein [Priestia flexa]MCG7314478.1 GIY-YIG nuclease family protein [Priestia flexa]